MKNLVLVWEIVIIIRGSCCLDMLDPISLAFLRITFTFIIFLMKLVLTSLIYFKKSYWLKQIKIILRIKLLKYKN